MEWWDALDEELAAVPPAVELRRDPSLSTSHYTTYLARFSSLGHYRIGAYLSLPHRSGLGSALLELPSRYGSTVHVPHHNDRVRHVVLTLMHRGQRHSDEPFRASFPGLFTLGIDDPGTYVYRGIIADCIRAAEVIATTNGVDPERIGVIGDDMVVLTAARRNVFRAIRVDGLRFTKAWNRRLTTDAYPLEELNELCLRHPQRQQSARRTLSMFDPIDAARHVRADTLVTVPSGVPLEPYTDLISALEAGARYDTTHTETEHDDRRDEWISGRLGVRPMTRFSEQAGVRATG